MWQMESTANNWHHLWIIFSHGQMNFGAFTRSAVRAVKDYYIYSDFTENPGNQCYVLPGAACEECIRRCADPDPPKSASPAWAGFHTESMSWRRVILATLATPGIGCRTMPISSGVLASQTKAFVEPRRSSFSLCQSLKQCMIRL